MHGRIAARACARRRWGLRGFGVMYRAIFRILGAILGLAFLASTIPLVRYLAVEWGWAAAPHVTTGIVLGVFLLHYAISGRTVFSRRSDGDD